MARNNLFLGKARGKIGDVVLSQLDGKQVARARNRSPKNPKTNKQMYQRAIMASVMLMYSAGKMIFDHSFEGKTVKFGAMRRFMSVNAKKLRAAILSDIADNVSTARVVSPGAVSPCPWLFRVSEGTYGKGVYSVVPAASAVNGPSLTHGLGSTDLVQDCYRVGDIYTVLVMYIDGTRGNASSLVSPPAKFGFARLEVVSLPDNLTVENATYGDIFDIKYSNLKSGSIPEEDSIEKLPYCKDLIPVGTYPAAMAVVHSREDSGLRSTADFVCNTGLDWGIASGNILNVWNAEVKSLGDSDLILEGGAI